MFDPPVGMPEHWNTLLDLGETRTAGKVIDPCGTSRGGLEVEDVAVRLGVQGRAALKSRRLLTSLS
jgi:hypothetical protein